MLTQAAVVKYLKLSKGRVSQLVKEGMPLTSKKDIDAWRKEKADGLSGTPEELKKRAEAAKLKILEKKAAKLEQDAEKARLEVMKLRGEMTPNADVRAEGKVIGELISSFLMKDARNHGVLYSDKSVSEIDAIAIPEAEKRILAIIEALEEVGKRGTVQLAKEAKEEKYGAVS